MFGKHRQYDHTTSDWEQFICREEEKLLLATTTTKN